METKDKQAQLTNMLSEIKLLGNWVFVESFAVESWNYGIVNRGALNISNRLDD